MAPIKLKWVRKFIIQQTARHEKGYTIYKVTSVVYLKSSHEEISKVSVWKRYNDFKKLYSDLRNIENHSEVKEPFPLFPRSNYFGRFDTEVIEKRKEHVLKLLNYIARHSSLYSSNLFIKFFETSRMDSHGGLAIGSDTSEDDQVDQRVPKISTRKEDTTENPVQYILIAAAHINAAVKHETIEEYEEAFTQYKMGISNLLNGVQYDKDLTRAESVRKQVVKYLETAERLYNRHLNCNISLLCKPISELKKYKVVRVMKSLMLVKDTCSNCVRILKTIEKHQNYSDNINEYILRGQVPYMVHLYAYIETESTIFLILQFHSYGKLTDYINSDKKFKCKDNYLKSELSVNDISTIRLVKKAQQLLQSVDEILKNTNNSSQKQCKVLEYMVTLWGAQILLALEALHQQEVIVLDLKLDNVLIDEEGNAQLIYITPRRNIELSKLKHPYCAPEISQFSPIISATPAADIWSYGVILYELLTGINFGTIHSRSFNARSIINIPNELSDNARSLLIDVLKYESNDRTTIPDLKRHQFFKNINWPNLVNPE